jgi:hypothetical protein
VGVITLLGGAHAGFKKRESSVIYDMYVYIPLYGWADREILEREFD